MLTEHPPDGPTLETVTVVNPDRKHATSDSVDFVILDWLRQHHPAWRLLAPPTHTALIASLLHRAFVAPNERAIDWLGVLTASGSQSV